MKRIFTILFLIITLVYNLQSQSYKFALFNNIQIDSNSSTNAFFEKIKYVNNNPEIKFVIVKGNLTAHGYPDEFELLKSILDSCNVPYYLLPDFNDIERSQSLGSDYNLIFGKTYFSFKKEDAYQIGIRGSKYKLSNMAHFPPKEINRLKKVINKIPTNYLIILFLNNPLKIVDNNWQIRNIFAGRKLFIVNPRDNTSFKILTVQNDSVYSTNNLLDSLSTNLRIEEKNFTQKDSTQFIDYSYLKKKRIPKSKANIFWQKNLQAETPNNILISKDKLFLVSKEGVIYCLDYKGNIKWVHNLKEIIISKPAITNDVLIVATTAGDLFTLKATTGEVIQSIGIDDALVTSVLKTRINYYGQETDAVVVGGSSGLFYCYTLNKLELVWNNNFSDSEIVTKPLSIKHRIIFGSKEGYLYSIDDRTGVLYWKWKPKRVKKTIVNFSNPVSDGKNIFATTSNGIIYKIDLLLGTTLWKNRTNKANLSLGLSSTGRTVITKSRNNKLNLFNSKTGHNYKGIRLNFGKDLIKHQPIEFNRNILISSDKGTLYLINKRYYYKPLFFLGNAALHSVQKINDNKFIVSNVDGKIVLFSLE